MNHTMRRNAGFSLIELMVASAIGLLLLTGLAMIFVNASHSNRELQKTAQQIENGRYAIDVLSQDLRLAGFYGHLADFEAIPAPAIVPPNPCQSLDVEELRRALWFPIQGYSGTIDPANPAGDTAPSIPTCAPLSGSNLKPGSDVLVIRRADTNHLRRPGDTDPDTPANGDTAESGVFYIQASAIQAEIQVGNGAPIENNKANGDASALFLSNSALAPPPAPVRRYHMRIYFVAPCSVGSGSGGVCTGAAGEDRIPTLKRLELSSTGTLSIVPLVEGIDYLKVEYGIDDLPATVTLATGLIGDSTIDRYAVSPAASDWANVIAARVYLLARNTEPTRDYVDDKTYTLGSIAVPARNDNFKRHVYTAAVRLTNPAGRREIP